MKLVRLTIGLHVLAAGALLSRAFAHGTPEEVADLWAQGLSNAQQKMQAGVSRVTQSPGLAAVAQRQKFVAKMQDPATFDKWERGLRGMSLGGWQNSMTSYGIQRAAQGATQKKSKYAAVAASLLPFVDNLRNTVKGMPSTTVADREQRMLAWSRGMAQYKKPATTS